MNFDIDAFIIVISNDIYIVGWDFCWDWGIE
jgi:hypothetical protein